MVDGPGNDLDFQFEKDEFLVSFFGLNFKPKKDEFRCRGVNSADPCIPKPCAVFPEPAEPNIPKPCAVFPHSARYGPASSAPDMAPQVQRQIWPRKLSARYVSAVSTPLTVRASREFQTNAANLKIANANCKRMVHTLNRMVYEVI